MGVKGGDLVKQIVKLAFGRSNDAVKLVFLDPEQQEVIDGLDLSMVAEIRRDSKGMVEVKLIDRLALLEMLSKLLEPESCHKNGEAENFYSALDKAATRIGGGT